MVRTLPTTIQVDEKTREALLGTGYITVVSSEKLDLEGGRWKCERSLSLADCYVLALAKLLDATVLFARRT